MTFICALVVAVPALGSSARARAQDNSGAEGQAAEQAPTDNAEPIPTDGAEGTGDAALSDEQALQAEANRPAVVRDATDPFEDPHEGYYFFGLMYRQIVVPEFMQGLFIEGGDTVSNPGVGVQFEYRKDAFSIIGSLWWQDFRFNAAFREAGDPEGNMEMLDSGWTSIFAAASFLWSTPFNDMFAIEYGVDVGLGVVLGDGIRTEAYSTDGGASYRACAYAGDPADTSGIYCHPTSTGATGPGVTDADGENGEHYNVTARKWSDGGGVPNVIPWLGIPHIALRIKPIHQLQIRIDGGFFAGFWFGASISYGI